jgi:predicted transcriptional regulator
MTENRPDALLLSVHPRYVSLMVAGEKTVEIRRIRPTGEPEALVLIYATAPTCQVVATGVLEGMVNGGADRLWRRFGRQACLTRQAMRDYLRGASRPTAMLLRAVAPLTAPISLTHLQLSIPEFRPPQSYRFLSQEMLHRLDLSSEHEGQEYVLAP